jgi:hypothetical protein
MAIAPAFTATGRVGVTGLTATQVTTARDGTGTLGTVITGVAAGTRIERIRIVATADPADSIVNLFLYDGTTAWFFDSFDIGNPSAGSTTADPMIAEKAYQNLVLPSASWSIRAAITVAPTSGNINVFAFGGDF